MPDINRRIWGSSPLTRGGLVSLLLLRSRVGLIPAYAGRTLLTVVCLPKNRAHPRLRGADVEGLVRLWSCLGSSPLTRGGPHVVWGERVDAGLIPAYAGRTTNQHHCGSLFGAHPRLRGADVWLPAVAVHEGGSSPLTRGGLRMGSSIYRRARLIPAYAGRTLTDQRGRAETRLADPTYGVTVSVGEHFGQHSSRCGVELLMVQWFFA